MLGPLGWATTAAQAALWTMEHRLETRAQVDSNPGLVPQPGAAGRELSLSGAWNGSRQNENSATQLQASAAAWWTSQGQKQRRVDARLDASQTWTDTLEEIRLSAQARQETTWDLGLQNTASAANAGSGQVSNGPAGSGEPAATIGIDLNLGRGQRRVAALAADYSRVLSQRLTMQLQGSHASTRYGAELPTAQAYVSDALSAQVAWRRSERDSFSLSLSGSHYATRSGNSNTARSEQLTLGWNKALTETSSTSLSMGAYRSRQLATQEIKLCPVPVAFCELGLSLPVRVQLQGRSAVQGLQYAAAYAWQPADTAQVQLKLERQQSPSGSGVLVRDERFSAQWQQALVLNSTVVASVLSTRTSYPAAADSPRPRLQVWSAAWSRRLSEDLTLQAGWQTSRSSEARSSQAARSQQVFLSLALVGPKRMASR